MSKSIQINFCLLFFIKFKEGYDVHIGSGYKGSSELLNSDLGNYELIPVKPNSDKRYSFYKFEFKSMTSPLTVKINEETIYLHNGYFSIDRYDSPIYSFIVIDENIDFSWIGAYVYK